MAYPKVTVVGAGQVGATAAFLMLEKSLCDVVLIDVAEGLPQGKALDMMHSRSVEHFGPKVSGTNDYAETAGSDVIVVTAGLARKPGMTRDDLLTANGRIIRSVVEKAVQTSPDAIVLCVTNPLDIMVDLAWKVSGLPAARVFGMGGVLDSARFAHFIAQETGADISTVDALACGAHGDAMVPMPRHSYIDGKRLTDLLSADRVRELRKRTIFGGAEVVSLLKTGSAFYAPAASIVSMVKAVLTDSGSVMPSCVRLNGEYGIEGVHMSVPARIGRAGVLEVPELDVDDVERTALQESAETIRVSIASLEAMDA